MVLAQGSPPLTGFAAAGEIPRGLPGQAHVSSISQHIPGPNRPMVNTWEKEGREELMNEHVNE